MARSFARALCRVRTLTCVVFGVLVCALVLGTVNVSAASAQVASAAAARAAAKPAPKMEKTRSVTGVRQLTHHSVRVRDDAKRGFRATAVHLPRAGTFSAPLGAPSRKAEMVRVGESPISVQQLSGAGLASKVQATVSVLPPARADARDLHGLMFTLAAPSSSARTVKLTVDYSSFAQLSGGGYGSRLGLVLLPDCAATATVPAQCPGQSAVSSVNDANAQTVTATITVPSTGRLVLGVTPQAVSTGPAVTTGAEPLARAATSVQAAASGSSADGGGPGGSYAATTLSPFGSWAQGGSTGSFTYSYPVAVPSSASALKPSIGLGYDSGSVDAKTSATAAQSSWVGDGWSTPDSYIQQSYAPCPDISSSLTNQDDCYAGPIVTMSLNGSSSQLVCDKAFTTCVPQQDDGSVVKRVTGASNGTYDGDYWTITKRDGTVYSFGLNHLPGYAAGKTSTNSVQTVPVYSANSGDPCYHKTAATFAGSVCTMGYRWNLDYVKDVHKQAMSYYYTPSTNYYGENKGTANVSYVRDAYLNHVDYGFTDGNAYGTVPAKVVYTPSSRCVASSCPALSSSTASSYPDVPFDLICASGAKCAVQSPSFFSTVRLTSITTQQYSAATSGYVSVDKYDLTQTIPTATSDDTPTLWLASLTHTGYQTDSSGTTTSSATPPVKFAATSLQNRVDTKTVPLPPMYRNRIGSITTETGSVLTVLYDRVNPCSSPVTVNPSSNTSSCFPVNWTPQGYTAPVKDWFNKYVVVAVNDSDTTGGAPALNTAYSYGGGAAWHFDDDEIGRAKYRTYGQFRGYGDVKTYLGNGGTDAKTLTDTSYYRGMSKNNSSTVVNVTDSLGGTHEDAGLLQGNVLETRVYQGNGGGLDHGTITTYWQSPATATRVRTGLSDLNAHIIAVAETLNQQAVTSGSTTTYRQSETDTRYDTTTTSTTYGLPLYTYSHSVPVSAAYDRCTSTSYAKVNTTVNLVGLVSGGETDSVPCSGFTEGSPVSVPKAFNTLGAPSTVSRPDQVVSATRSFYDVTTFATTFPQSITPTLGDVTMTQTASGASSGALTWVTNTRNAYDSRGRVKSSTDAKGYLTSTTYTDSAQGLTTAMKVTNPKSQSVSTTLDPERGQALTVTDANGVVTTSQYDALGRVTAVWLASRATSTPANYTYSYVVSQSGVSSATTKRLNSAGGYASSVLLYDSLLRPRQTQASTPQGGRMVADEFYDTRGWVSSSNNGWFDSASSPGTSIVSASSLDAQVPNSDLLTYDGLGRVVVDVSRQNVSDISKTTTIYGGDRTTVIPPTGSVTQTTYTDVLGRTTKLAQYTSAPTITAPSNITTGHWTITGGSTTSTSFGYDGHDNQSTTTDPAGNIWTSTYNVLGQVTSKKDPDAGTSTMNYDADGNLTQSTDARGKVTSSTYDELGRKTASYDAASTAQVPFGNSGANQTAKWVYDNSDSATTGLSLAYPIGHVSTATSYSGGAAYVTQAKGFTTFGASLGETVTIPSNEKGLAGSYTFTHTYMPNNGIPFRDTYAASTAAGLPVESVTHGYSSALDAPTSLGGQIGATTYGYNSAVSYDAYGRVAQSTLGGSSTTGLAYLNNTWDAHTGLLTNQSVSGSLRTPTTAIDGHAYTYDLAGNTTRDVDTRLGSSSTKETQCYAFDAVDRLSAAWTATDNCAATPTSSAHSMVGDGLGGSSAYWSTWSYNAVGQRTAQVTHAGGTGAAATTTYGYSTSQPTALTSTSTSGGSTGSTTYGYDAGGNMTSRKAAQGSQVLSWDAGGRLSSVATTPSGSSTATTSTYTYDADGGLLVQHDGAASTLYLPGEQLSMSSSGAVTGIRYYALPGGASAYRTGSGNAYGYEVGDAHGTASLLLDYTGQNPTWRQFSPFGEARGAGVSWVDNRTFLDKPTDGTTGLTNVGARYYDPVTAQFISLDPMFAPAEPQALNGYSYAGENPVTFADPTGLDACNTKGSSCSNADIFGLNGGPSASPDWPGGTPDPSDPPAKPSKQPSGSSGGGGSANGGSGYGGGSTRSAPPQHHGWFHWPSWHTVAKAAVGVAVGVGVAVAVGAICSTGVGCVILAATVAGAASGASTYGTSVALGDDEFSVRGLATATVVGGAGGALTGGASVAVGAVARAVISGGASQAAEAAVEAAAPKAVTAGRDIAEAGASKSASAGRAAASCATNSFAASTLVLMAGGGTKAISQITAGDTVKAVDPHTGKTTTGTVTATWVNTDTAFTDLRFTATVGGNRVTTVLHTTSHHRIWDQTTGTFADAIHLLPGHQARTDDGHVWRLAATRSWTGRQRMFDITVDHVHTFYVLAGTTPVLVHNCGSDAAETAAAGPARFVASKQGIIDTQSPALSRQVGGVEDSLRTTGSPPPGVRQGGLPGKPGVYGNRSGALPAQPEGYYTESDVWPGPGPRGGERIVTGGPGEVWYTPDHYGTFRPWPW